MTFTEEERGFIANEFLELNQNANLRDLYNAVLVQSILSKFQSIVVSLTQQENGLLQSYLTYKQEGLARLTDQRLQHILMSQNSQGFGMDSGSNNRFFHSGKQYQLGKDILAKLMGS